MIEEQRLLERVGETEKKEDLLKFVVCLKIKMKKKFIRMETRNLIRVKKGYL